MVDRGLKWSLVLKSCDVNCLMFDIVFVFVFTVCALCVVVLTVLTVLVVLCVYRSLWVCLFRDSFTLTFTFTLFVFASLTTCSFDCCIFVCFEHNGGRVLDKFYGRVMFPIHSLSGRVIAFGGRTLREDKGFG